MKKLYKEQKKDMGLKPNKKSLWVLEIGESWMGYSILRIFKTEKSAFRNLKKFSPGFKKSKSGIEYYGNKRLKLWATIRCKNLFN